MGMRRERIDLDALRVEVYSPAEVSFCRALRRSYGTGERRGARTPHRTHAVHLHKEPHSVSLRCASLAWRAQHPCQELVRAVSGDACSFMDGDPVDACDSVLSITSSSTRC